MIPWMTLVKKTERRTQQDHWTEVTHTQTHTLIGSSKRRVLSINPKLTPYNQYEVKYVIWSHLICAPFKQQICTERLLHSFVFPNYVIVIIIIIVPTRKPAPHLGKLTNPCTHVQSFARLPQLALCANYPKS